MGPAPVGIENNIVSLLGAGSWGRANVKGQGQVGFSLQGTNVLARDGSCRQEAKPSCQRTHLQCGFVSLPNVLQFDLRIVLTGRAPYLYSNH